MTVCSVISSRRSLGRAPASAISRATIAGNSRLGEVLRRDVDGDGQGSPARRHADACASACASVQRVSSGIASVPSARPRNALGPSRPRTGWCQRSSASTPTTRPSASVTLGWKCSSSSLARSARRSSSRRSSRRRRPVVPPAPASPPRRRAPRTRGSCRRAWPRRARRRRRRSARPSSGAVSRSVATPTETVTGSGASPGLRARAPRSARAAARRAVRPARSSVSASTTASSSPP